MSRQARSERDAAVLRHLLGLRARGELTPESFRWAAKLTGKHNKTMRRWVERGRIPRPRHKRFEASERDLEAFFEARGRVTAAWKRRSAEDHVPSLSTWRRAIDRSLTPAQKAFAKEGEAGRRAWSLHLRYEVAHRNEIWEGDDSQLDVLVIPDRGHKPVRPWLTAFIDASTRAIVGYAISFNPDRAQVLAALHSAVLVDPSRGPFGGVPDLVRYDNARAWLSDDVTRAFQALGSLPAPVHPYSPHLKGKIERFFGTLDEELLSQEPFFTGGPRAANREHYGPRCDPLPIGQSVERLDRYINEYNNQRPHGELGGASPREAWEADTRAIRHVGSEEVRWLLVRRVRRRAGKVGIHLHRRIFFAPELDAMVGETVEIAYKPYQLNAIEVFRGKEWVATAKPIEEVDAGDRKRFIERRKEDRKRGSELRRRASSKERLSIEPLTGPGPVHRRPLAAERADRAREADRDHQIREFARDNLLGLEED